MKGITLESVEEAFCKWRVERSSRAELIPEELWAMALRLYPHAPQWLIEHESQYKKR